MKWFKKKEEKSVTIDENKDGSLKWKESSGNNNGEGSVTTSYYQSPNTGKNVKTTETKPTNNTIKTVAAPKKTTKPAEKKTSATPIKNTASVAKKPATAKSATSAKTEEDKVWHITKRADDGKWQVKREGGSKATKLFRTKAEAQEYVKTLKSNNEGSRVVSHKKTGEFQKKS